ncbi:UspA domain-containing protein [Caballeronia terrestris]|uniref:UspA domain-containing protein n=1 Tax=Caballeronia terrestris TaxID=1226301 RepID=A0A158KPL2_9BURK|nr:universal stress protein [Caballeronia terrestris]SAL82689.1 UspA domain-containing protein [Caballeronia terrestris]
MSYKSIAVHLDTSKRAHARLEIALRLARDFEAELTGVFAIFMPVPQPMCVMAGSADYYAAHEETRARHAGAIERLFRAEAVRAEVPGRWVEAREHDEPSVSRYGRCADLVIAGQDDPSDPESFIADHFIEDLVMESGRPVLLVPYAGEFPTIGTRVMLAWDGSREATRAVHDALPFLQRARQVTVVTVNELSTRSLASQIPGAEIALTIGRHDVKVEVNAIEGAHDASIGDVLLSRASNLGADLLVMGAYGHARWRELVLGGATRTLLKSSTLPLLLSH